MVDSAARATASQSAGHAPIRAIRRTRDEVNRLLMDSLRRCGRSE